MSGSEKLAGLSGVTRIFTGAVALVIERFRRLVQALGILFVAAAVLALIPLDPKSGLAAVTLILQLVVQTLFAVATHRIVILGLDSVPKWGPRTWGQRETVFVLYLLGLSLAALTVLALVAILPPLLIVALGIGIAVILSSLSLVFPAVAIGDELDLLGAWRLADGYRFIMFATVCIFPILLAIPLVPIAYFSMQALPVVAVVLQSLMTVFTVTALSVAYSEIRRENQ